MDHDMAFDEDRCVLLAMMGGGRSTSKCSRCNKYYDIYCFSPPKIDEHKSGSREPAFRQVMSDLLKGELTSNEILSRWDKARGSNWIK